MDYLKILNIVRRYLWLVVLTVSVASLTSFFVLRNQPSSFKTTTLLLVGPGADNPSPDLNSLKIGGQLVQTYAELVDTRPFLESVNDKLSQKSDPTSLSAMIRVRPNVEARVLTIIVYHPDPKQAVVIANAIAETLVEASPSKDNTTDLLRTQMANQYNQLEQIITNAQTSIQELEAELATLKTGVQRRTNLERQNLIIKQLTEERARLSDALRTSVTVYQLLLGTNTNQIQIIEPAAAVFPVGASQDIALKIALTAVSGLIFALIIIFAAEYIDDRIRFPGDFSRAAEAPLLSAIDKHNHLKGSGLERVVAFAQPTSPAANNYRTAVAKLVFSIGESRPCTFLLSSVGSQSGDDTAVATANLGVAFAQAGNRVVLVDAQFHNPVLTELFDANGKTGLADFLANKSSKLKLVPLKEVPGVQLLPAGFSSEKWPGSMLNSANIVSLIEELQKEAEIVLVLGSPISWFAESLVLASKVNGVILVARYGEAHIKMVNEVTENLRVMNVQLAGVIFDNNPSPFAAVARTASKTALLEDLKSTGQVDADTTRTPDLAIAAIPAAENTGSAGLDQVDIDTIQTPDLGNLPMPTDKIEVSSLATVDVDPAQSPNLTDSSTSTDEITSLEEVAVDPTQHHDLGDLVMPANENLEVSISDNGFKGTQINVPQDTKATKSNNHKKPIQFHELAESTMPEIENVEMPGLDTEKASSDETQVDDLEQSAMPTSENPGISDSGSEKAPVDETQFHDVDESGIAANENLELALLDTDVEAAKIKIPHGKKVTKRTSHKKATQSHDLDDLSMPANENLELPNLDQVDVDSAQSPDLHNSTMLSEENLELALLDTDVEAAKINDLKNSKGSHRVNHRKRNKH